MTDDEKNKKQYEVVRADAETWYHSVGEVVCPYFKEAVAFNAKGLRHITFKRNAVTRSAADQLVRFKYIRFAQRILEKSKTVQEFKEEKSFEEKKSNGARELVLQTVQYFGFIAIINDSMGMRRFKIIVKRVGGGKLYFWSIIPFWRQAKGMEREMHAGLPAED
jgi:hypothetical protein